MPQLVQLFLMKFKVTYFVIPTGGSPLPILRSRELLLNRETSDFMFMHEELKVLAMKCGDEETEFVDGVAREVPLERIEIVGIIPLAD